MWLDFALACDYITVETHKDLFTKMDWVIGKLVNMARHPEKWAVL